MHKFTKLWSTNMCTSFFLLSLQPSVGARSSSPAPRRHRSFVVATLVVSSLCHHSTTNRRLPPCPLSSYNPRTRRLAATCCGNTAQPSRSWSLRTAIAWSWHAGGAFCSIRIRGWKFYMPRRIKTIVLWFAM